MNHVLLWTFWRPLTYTNRSPESETSLPLGSRPLHMPTHTEQKLSRQRCVSVGELGSCVPTPRLCQLQSRSVLCFLAKLPTNPTSPDSPISLHIHDSLAMQSLLNYKAGVK